MFRGARRRVLRSFFLRPIRPFVIEFLVLAPLVLADTPTASVPGVVFFLPWLLVLFALINFPFVLGAFRAFHLDRDTRRNHAIEHATIHFLEATGTRRLSGQAHREGFRVSGRVSPSQIRKAFDQVRRALRDGEPLPYVSRRCGSNVISALGLALLLLLVVTLGCLVLEPSLLVRASALAFVVLFFVAMRHAVGNWIQARFFMATDFEEVSMRDIYEVEPGPFERRPVHFVATIVRPIAGSAPS